jgi:hypothetical protein
MRRPVGVLILAILYWVGACGLLLGGIALAVGLSVAGRMATGMPSPLAGVGVIGGIVMMGLGAVMAFVGYGMFQMFEWARITTIVLAGLGLVAAVFGFIHPFAVSRFSLIVRIAIDGFIIWYLVQPGIVAMFRRA